MQILNLRSDGLRESTLDFQKSKDETHEIQCSAKAQRTLGMTNKAGLLSAFIASEPIKAKVHGTLLDRTDRTDQQSEPFCRQGHVASCSGHVRDLRLRPVLEYLLVFQSPSLVVRPVARVPEFSVERNQAFLPGSYMYI